MVDLPPLTYLSMDAVSDGIGLSQVARYVERLALRGIRVTLHSYEHGPARQDVGRQLEAAGVRWRPHRFGISGAPGGLVRVAHGAALTIGAELVHARSDLAAASCLISRRRAWVWDVRAFWREQRVATGILTAGSPQEVVLRRVEREAARACTGIVTLSRAAVAVLRDRYGEGVAAKATVITTCVDLELFSVSPWPDGPLRLLIAGTLSPIYDVPAMLRLSDALGHRRPTELTILTSQRTSFDEEFRRRGLEIRSADPSEMPDAVRQHHVGLSILRDVGVSNRAVSPTKLGEFLASGRPVVVNAGLGDMDELLTAHDCGVVVADLSDEGLAEAVEGILRLVDDPDTPARCRKLAEEHFDLDRGIDALVALYQQAAR